MQDVRRFLKDKLYLILLMCIDKTSIYFILDMLSTMIPTPYDIESTIHSSRYKRTYDFSLTNSGGCALSKGSK